MVNRRLSRRIEEALQELQTEWSPSIGDLKQFPNRFRKNVYEYCWDPANRDGRGVSSQALKRIMRVLSHTRSALKVVRERQRDPNTVKSAMKFLKRLAHDKDFVQSHAGSRKFRGKLQKDGQRRNERKMYGKPTIHRVAGRFEISRICCLEDLKRAGRELNCCVAGNYYAKSYWNDCIRGSSELWTISNLANEELVGLVSIDTDEPRAIVEVQGRENAAGDHDLRFSFDEMISLRKILRIVDDQHDSVIEAGAFDEFLTGTFDFNEPMNTVAINKQQYDLWQGTGLLVLRSVSSQGENDRYDPHCLECDEEHSLPQWTRFKHQGSEGWSLTSNDNYVWSTGEPLGEIFSLYPWLIDACKPHRTCSGETTR